MSLSVGTEEKSSGGAAVHGCWLKLSMYSSVVSLAPASSAQKCCHQHSHRSRVDVASSRSGVRTAGKGFKPGRRAERADMPCELRHAALQCSEGSVKLRCQQILADNARGLLGHCTGGLGRGGEGNAGQWVRSSSQSHRLARARAGRKVHCMAMPTGVDRGRRPNNPVGPRKPLCRYVLPFVRPEETKPRLLGLALPHGAGRSDATTITYTGASDQPEQYMQGGAAGTLLAEASRWAYKTMVGVPHRHEECMAERERSLSEGNATTGHRADKGSVWPGRRQTCPTPFLPDTGSGSSERRRERGGPDSRGLETRKPGSWGGRCYSALDFRVLPCWSRPCMAVLVYGIDSLGGTSPCPPACFSMLRPFILRGTTVQYQRVVAEGPYFDCRRKAVRRNATSRHEASQALQHRLVGLPVARWHAVVDQQYDLLCARMGRRKGST